MFELPIFPLNVVLFPGMPLPLHIFEPRYRLMISRVLEGDKTFGVALIIEGVEGQTNTFPAIVGTTAKILEAAPFADGRINLQTIGARRFSIVELREEDDYLVGTCQWLEDAAEECAGLARKTRALLRRYLETMAQTTHLDVELESVEIPDEPYLLSMWTATILSLPNEQKQTLLELTSTATRLELEEFLLRRADIVQRAYAKRLENGYIEPPYDSTLGPMAGFASLN